MDSFLDSLFYQRLFGCSCVRLPARRHGACSSESRLILPPCPVPFWV